MRTKLQLVAVVCCLTACASAPKINYYTLDMESSGTVNPPVNLVVERVRTTDALSRNQIMVLASPTRVEYYATDHWVGNLADIVRQKLTAEFGPGVEGRQSLALSVMVLSCEQVDGAAGADARMQLRVTVRDPSEKRYREPLFEKTYEVSRPAENNSASAIVEALSICAEEIAADIAVDVGGL